MLLKRSNIEKRLYCILLLLGITVSVCLLFITTQKLVDNTFLSAIWSLPAYAIIAGLFGCENNNIAKVLFQNKLVLYLGRMSLELFLIHQLVIRYVETLARKLHLMSTNMYSIAFLISVIGATALHSIKLRRAPKG